MTNQLLLGIAVVVVALLIAYELIETWRWQGFANRPRSRFRVVRGVRRAIGGLVGIVTLRRWRRPRTQPVAAMTEDDLARRLGDAPSGPVHLQPGRIVVSGARVPPPQPVRPVVPLPPPVSPRPSRLRLARDMIGAALLMGGFVVVFANVMPPISGPTTPEGRVLDATATPVPTLEIRTAVPQTSVPSPGAIASSVPGAPPPSPDGTGLVSAVPTPTNTERPKPAAAPRPTDPPPPQATPAPTPRPTAKPTSKPTPKPTARPAVISGLGATPNPASVGESVVVSFSYSNATTYTISFSDGAEETHALNGNGTESVPAHAFLEAGNYSVVVVVDGPGAQDSASVTVAINGP